MAVAMTANGFRFGFLNEMGQNMRGGGGGYRLLLRPILRN